MTNKRRVFLFEAVIAVRLIIASYGTEFLRTDACLDDRGTWDYEQKSCKLS